MDVVMSKPEDRLLNVDQLVVGKVYQSGCSNTKVWLCVLNTNRDGHMLVRLSDSSLWRKQDVQASVFVEVVAKVVVE